MRLVGQGLAPSGERKVKVLVTQLCPSLCNSMDCGQPGSSVHGILQARTSGETALINWMTCLKVIQASESYSLVPVLKSRALDYTLLLSPIFQIANCICLKGLCFRGWRFPDLVFSVWRSLWSSMESLQVTKRLQAISEGCLIASGL